MDPPVPVLTFCVSVVNSIERAWPFTGRPFGNPRENDGEPTKRQSIHLNLYIWILATGPD